nr:hypothetical protein [Flavobacterium sp. ASV13]
MVNLAVCAIAVLMGGFDYFFIIFLSFGFLMSIGYKELYRKQEYLFYSNNGISKNQLLVFSYLLTFCTTVLIGVITFLIRVLF